MQNKALHNFQSILTLPKAMLCGYAVSEFRGGNFFSDDLPNSQFGGGRSRTLQFGSSNRAAR